MKRTNVIILAGLLVGGLGIAGIAVTANANESHGYPRGETHGQHKGWQNNHSKKFDHSTHDRRDFQRGRWDDQHGRDVRHDFRHDGRIENRGHHNKPEIQRDFKDTRAARKEVQQDRGELRKDYTELRKDRAELRRDIRSGASKEEVMKDRLEIRSDWKEIANDRAELKKDQTKLDGTRMELKRDLRTK